MLKNTLQILLAFSLLGTAICPCLAQSLIVEEDSHHAHMSGDHHDAGQSLPECHGGDGGSKCASVSGAMGESAKFILTNGFQAEDDATVDIDLVAIDQPNLTHHGGSPPPTKTFVADTPVSLQDRLIE